MLYAFYSVEATPIPGPNQSVGIRLARLMDRVRRRRLLPPVGFRLARRQSTSTPLLFAVCFCKFMGHFYVASDEKLPDEK